MILETAVLLLNTLKKKRENEWWIKWENEWLIKSYPRYYSRGEQTTVHVRKYPLACGVIFKHRILR
jgi:hypothetical protein